MEAFETPWRGLALPLLMFAAAAVACGEQDAAPAPRDPGPAVAGPQTPSGFPGVSVADADRWASKPTVVIDKTARKPRKLVVRDLVRGRGRRVAAGDVVSVRYVGVSWSTGDQFDSSWEHGQPFTFRVGAGEVIGGWDRGVPGIRAGGRRLLIIPPRLGYGPDGAPPAIGPDETLIFVVDAVPGG